MMTVTENTASSMSQSIDYNNYPINRSYSTTMTYDYPSNYATFSHPSSLFSTGTTMNKSYHPSSIDPMSNFNHFYRRHTESPGIYSSSTSNSNPFNYSPGLFFGWNNGSSLLRTHSSSYPDYSNSQSYPTIHEKSRVSYPPFFNLIPPTDYSIPPPPVPPSNQVISHSSIKRSIPSKITKRPRLTAYIRREILKLKSTQPTIYVWEIQQNLVQNGICTSQTLPTPAVIQRVINESLKNSVIIKEEAKINVNFPSVTICLSPSPSPTLSNGESHSECSICLESYRSGQEVSILACSHEYHSSCIGEWMLKNRSCPMCRKDIHNQPQFVTLLI